MTIKTTGAELKEFFGFDWKIKDMDCYLEWIKATVNGVAVGEDELDVYALDDADIIQIIDGTIVAEESSDVHDSFASVFNKWKKAKTTVTFMVSCNKADYDTLVAVIKANKGKV